MLEEIFPGLGNLIELSATCNICVCGCSACDPTNDDYDDDKKGEKAPNTDPVPF